MSDDFPVSRLGALLKVNTHTTYRDVRHGRYGAPFKVAGRLHVKVAAVERAAARHFTYGELKAALAPPRVAIAPEPTDIELRTALEMIEAFEARHRNGLYSREDVLGIVRYNIGLRDQSWFQFYKRALNQTAFPERPIIPDRAAIEAEIADMKTNGEPHV